MVHWLCRAPHLEQHLGDPEGWVDGVLKVVRKKKADKYLKIVYIHIHYTYICIVYKYTHIDIFIYFFTLQVYTYINSTSVDTQ